MPKIIEIMLRTKSDGANECVTRTPTVINGHRKDIDVVRITNKNPEDTGSSITVTMDAATLGNVFVDPPADPQELDPGQSLDLTVKSTPTGSHTEGFATDPGRCEHHDSGDIVIQP
jgi:hypothetical protein